MVTGGNASRASKAENGRGDGQTAADAVDSIRVGVEDYETGERVRALAAVRNLHAGCCCLPSGCSSRVCRKRARTK